MAIGGRTGRDGIHGATFSSAELTSESESLSGGAVQIGNAITEKMVLDVLLVARDRGLYNAVTDCGAGGFSSAVGEMGEEIGRRGLARQVPRSSTTACRTPKSGSPKPRNGWCFAVPPRTGTNFTKLCAEGGRSDGDRQVRADRLACN